jgi:mono/diheme cytochrome c family protein
MATGITRKRLFVLIGSIVLIGAVASGVAMIRHGFSARDNPTWVETLVARTVRSMSVPSRAKQMKNPVQNTRESLAAAEAHWADHCAVCHANDGGGETVIGKNLYPKAPDMRLPSTQNLSDGELYYTIQNGIRLTGMPAWGEAGDKDEDTWKLVHFIRHLPQLTPEEEKGMERLNPKGPEDKMEEQEEQEFINQSAPAVRSPHHQKHH